MIYFNGTVLASPVVNGSALDVYGTHYSVLGVGGYVEVQTTSQRDLIPVNSTNGLDFDGLSSGRRRLGMLVGVAETNLTYKLYIPYATWTSYNTTQKINALADNTNWVLYNTNSTGTTYSFLTGSSNGLTTTTQNVSLGGTLNQNTSIAGNDLYYLHLGSNASPTGYRLSQLGVYSCGGVILNSSSTNISDSINLSTNNNSFSISCGCAVFTDNTSIQRGIMYAADYSTTYCSRSLVDKGYVDVVASGLNPKQAVLVASTGNTNIGTPPSKIDGITMTANKRVLLKDQTVTTQNGIYLWNSSGMTRSSDFDGAPVGEVTQGSYTFVITGSTNKSTSWILTTPNPITVGVTSMTWGLFSKLFDITAGNGIIVTTLSGNRVVATNLDTNSGLCYNVGKLTIDQNVAGNGLSWSTGVINANACSGGAVAASAIPLRYDGSDNLVINISDTTTCLGNPVNSANNGLTKSGQNVKLGGTLTGDTTIAGANNSFILTNLKNFNIAFNSGSTITDNDGNGGLKYAANYSSKYTARSIPDVGFVTGCTSQSTTLACNGLCRNGLYVGLGGNLSQASTIITGTSSQSLTICHGSPSQNRTKQIFSSGEYKVQSCNTSFGFETAVETCLNLSQACSVIRAGYSAGGSGCGCAEVCAGVLNLSACNGAVCSKLNINSTNIVVTSTFSTPMCYAGNYISNMTSRDYIPSVGFVTGCTSAIVGSLITLASNGLKKVGTSVIFGGSLTGDTTLNTSNKNFRISGTSNVYVNSNSCVLLYGSNNTGTISIGGFDATPTLKTSIDINATKLKIYDGRTTPVGIEYCSDYSANYTSRSLVDRNYVDNAVVSSGTVFTNGLTKLATNVCLGGTLITDTTINTNSYSYYLNGTAGRSLYFLNNGSGSVTLGYGVNFLGKVSRIEINSISGISSVNNICFVNTNGGISACSIFDCKGFSYANDYTSKNTTNPRWIPDKNYVDIKADRIIPNVITISTALSVSGGTYFVNQSTPVTLTLPASPADGIYYIIKDASGTALTNVITISGNGHNIDGNSSSSINTNYGGVSLAYSSTLTAWYDLSFTN